MEYPVYIYKYKIILALSFNMSIIGKLGGRFVSCTDPNCMYSYMPHATHTTRSERVGRRSRLTHWPVPDMEEYLTRYSLMLMPDMEEYLDEYMRIGGRQ